MIIRQILKTPYFWVGLAVRFAFMPFFGSYFLRDLFIPFLDFSVLHLGTNPWANLPAHYFPYGSVLLGILLIPRWLAYTFFGKIALGGTWLSLTLLKLPLLALDFALLAMLAKISEIRWKKVLIYFWLNPVAIYITYLHGQLDIAATFFCILSILLLGRKQFILSGLTLAAGTLCKFHVAAIVPFMLAFVWNNLFLTEARRSIGLWLGTYLSICIVGFLPLFLAQKLAYATTASPEAFRIFGASLSFGDQQVLYVGILLVLAVLGRLCISTRITQRGLFFGGGVIFGALVLATNAMPGWYFWILPFLSLFYACYPNAPKSCFVVFSALYLIYFVIFPRLDLDSFSFTPGLIFTFLQASVAGNLIFMWSLVVKREAVIHKRTHSFLVGVAGDSGAGKNHITGLLRDIFNQGNTLVIEGDNYHRWERGNGNWEFYTHLNPRANNLSKMESHTLQLLHGRSVQQRFYDHETGRFTEARELLPQRVTIIQGLHTLYLRGMREHLDLKIFVSPEDHVRLAWKLKRDTEERGSSVEKVLQSLNTRIEDSRDHIDPQRNFADWIVEYFLTEALTKDQIIGGAPLKLGVKHTLWNDAPLDELIQILNELSCSTEVEKAEPGFDRTAIRVVGSPTGEAIAQTALRLFPDLRHITRGKCAPCFNEGYDGINQLVALTLLRKKMGSMAYDSVY